MNKKLLVGLGLAVSLFGVAGCTGAGESGEGEPSPDNGGTEQEGAPQGPDLEGIPDVVAEVNGEEISKDEFVSLYEGQFQQLQAQSQSTGEELDQEQLRVQTAEVMVDTELLIQEADGRNFEASQEDVDTALDELATANQLESADEFLAAIKEQGTDEAEVMTQLETQVKLDRLIAEEAGDTEPTEEELQALYDQAAAQQEEVGEEGAELPPFDDVRPQLVEQAVTVKESEAYETLVADLREDADVTVNL